MDTVGTVTPRGLRIMRACSVCTIFTSYGFAFAYASRPHTISVSLFGALAIHWVWAVIQGMLGTGIALSHVRGGYHIQLAHAIGFVTQSIYCTLWLVSAIYTGNGWFIWPGVFFLCVGHFVLSRLKWRKRQGAKAVVV
jgi:hypothetical protein